MANQNLSVTEETTSGGHSKNQVETITTEWSEDTTFFSAEEGSSSPVVTRTRSESAAGSKKKAQTRTLHQELEVIAANNKAMDLYQKSKGLSVYKKFYYGELLTIGKNSLKAFYLKSWIESPQTYPGLSSPECFISIDYVIETQEKDNEEIKTFVLEHAKTRQIFGADLLKKRADLCYETLKEKYQDVIQSLSDKYSQTPVILDFLKKQFIADLKISVEKATKELTKHEEWLAEVPWKVHEKLAKGETTKKDRGGGSKQRQASKKKSTAKNKSK